MAIDAPIRMIAAQLVNTSKDGICSRLSLPGDRSPLRQRLITAPFTFVWL